MGRRAAQVVLAAVGIALIVGVDSVRRVETILAGEMASWLTPGRSVIQPQRYMFAVGIGEPTARGLTVTVACSQAVVIAIVLCLSALLLSGGRLSAPRLLTAVALAVPVLFVLGVARMALIGWASVQWGDLGYTIAHVWAGTLVSLGSVALTLLIVVRVSTGGANR